MDYHLYTSSAAKATDTDRTPSSSIEPERLRQLARETKFQQRDRGKITPQVFVDAIIDASFKEAVSFRQLAVLGGGHANDTLAKQSVWERVNARAVSFLSAVLCEAMSPHDHRLVDSLPDQIKRVLIQDSTIVKLHPSLHNDFPGARNQSRVHQAAARVQVVIDLLAGEFLQFGLSGFTRNDQAASHDILPLLTPGDLILRDLGYFTLASFEAIHDQDAFFLSRLRYKSTLLDGEGEKIDLPRELRRASERKEDRVIFEAAMGASRKLPVRVIAVRVPASIAMERKRKARADRDGRLSHDEAYYESLEWSIFVTNLPEDIVENLDLLELYGLRWRVENIFKAWKGGLRPECLSRHRSNPWHLRCLLLGQLLALTHLSKVGVFSILAKGGPFPTLSGQSHLSLFKALDILLLVSSDKSTASLNEATIRQINYHGRYEKRKRTPLPAFEIDSLA